jgi:hypothetical protein
MVIIMIKLKHYRQKMHRRRAKPDKQIRDSSKASDRQTGATKQIRDSSPDRRDQAGQREFQTGETSRSETVAKPQAC